MLEWKMIRVKDTVHSKINQLGTCGMSKSDVIESLISFYDKSNSKNKQLKELLA